MKKNTLQEILGRRLRPSLDRNHLFVFERILTILGGLTVICLISVLLTLYLFSNQIPESYFRVALLLIGTGIPFAIIVVAFLSGINIYRRMGKPFADIMSASDAIANGDLSTRLPENYHHQEMGDLAKRFNNMVKEMERADQQRKNLTADIAHELRTPLQIIQGNLEGVLDGVFELDEANITDTLDETRLLARLVNDLQTLSLAENGELALHTRPFLLADLLSDAATGFESRAAAQNVTLHTDTSDLSLKISADYDRLIQVISNLVANALRFTPENGKITLCGEAASQGARITISDTGTGISSEDLPYIFDRFWRGDKSRERAKGNNGLGLAISKQLVLAHGGTISAQSELGEGATFVIELPAQNLR